VHLRNLLAAVVLLASQLALTGSAAAEPASATPPIPCQRAAIPAYFGIGNDWDQVVSLSQGSDVLIVNLADGPGPTPRADYRAAIQKARQSGTKVVGYVYTVFTQRDIAAVKKDIDNFKGWFGVDGIFIDNMAWEPEKVGYYRELHDYIKGFNGFIVGNPGQVPDRAYMDTADVLVTFEGTYDSYVSRQFPDWGQSYSPDRFSHLIYDTNSPAQMANVMQLSVARNAGYVYATDGRMPQNWQTLPRYYPSEVAQMRGNCFTAAVAQPQQ